MAGAGQDHHDGPPGGFAVGALELHHGRLGSVWCAASSVCAGAAVARFIGLGAGAVLVGEVDGCLAPHHPLALAASLQGRRMAKNVNSISEKTKNKNSSHATCIYSRLGQLKLLH